MYQNPTLTKFVTFFTNLLLSAETSSELGKNPSLEVFFEAYEYLNRKSSKRSASSDCAFTDTSTLRIVLPDSSEVIFEGGPFLETILVVAYPLASLFAFFFPMPEVPFSFRRSNVECPLSGARGVRACFKVMSLDSFVLNRLYLVRMVDLTLVT